MIDATLFFIRDAPLWLLIVAFIAVYVAILVVGTWIRRRWMAEQSGGQEREHPRVSGEVNINAGRDVTNYGEIAGVIQKFGMQPRTLTSKDVEAAVARRAKYPGTAVMVGAVPGIPDGKQLARTILNLLREAQWAAGSIGSINVASDQGFLPPGVLIDYSGAPNSEPFEALCRVLNDLGIQASFTNWGFPWPAVVVSDPT
jgi:hypothetical protein